MVQIVVHEVLIRHMNKGGKIKFYSFSSKVYFIT